MAGQRLSFRESRNGPSAVNDQLDGWRHGELLLGLRFRDERSAAASLRHDTWVVNQWVLGCRAGVHLRLGMRERVSQWLKPRATQTKSACAD